MHGEPNTEAGEEMPNKWCQAVANLTREALSARVLIKSSALACVATFLSVPYFHFLLQQIPRQNPALSVPNPHEVLFSQSGLFFLICLLSIMVGYGFKKRYRLPGFGRIDQWRRSLPSLLLIGLLVLLVSDLVFDRYFAAVSPVPLPDSLLYLIAIPLNGTLADELILRFGLVTLGVGLCRNKHAGVALVSFFAAILTEKYFRFIGLGPDLHYLFAIRFVLAFAINFLLGYLFVTRGLLYSMTVRLILGLRYPLLALMMT